MKKYLLALVMGFSFIGIAFAGMASIINSEIVDYQQKISDANAEIAQDQAHIAIWQADIDSLNAQLPSAETFDNSNN